MNIKKKYTYVLVLSILMVLTIVLLSSYAWWRIKREQSGSNQILGACLDISYEEQVGDNGLPITGLTIDGSWPITDAEGIQSEGYTFTVRNTCSNVEELNYEIVLESLETLDPNKHMPEEYIRLRLDDKEILTYKNLEDYPKDTNASYAEDILNTKSVYKGKLIGNEPQTHTLRSWFSIDAPSETIGYQFNSKVKVYAGQGITVPEQEPVVCYAVEPVTGELVKYNAECGKNVVIPDSYMGIPIKSIGTNAFVGQAAVFEGGIDSLEDERVLFAVARSDNYLTAMQADDPSLLTKDDIWIVKYKEGADVDAAIDTAIANDSMMNEMKSMFNLTDEELKSKVCIGKTQGCSDGFTSFVYGLNESAPVVIGYRYSYEMAVAMGMDPNEIPVNFEVDSIDFSIATNLIELKSGSLRPYNPADLVLPNSLQIIGDHALEGYTGIVDKETGEPVSIQSLNNYSDQSELIFKELNLPSSLVSIGDNAFTSYYGIGKTLTIPNNVTDIGDAAFTLFNGDHLILGSKLENIGDNTFKNYENEITLPASLVSIGEEAFDEVDFDLPLVLPTSLEYIGKEAFDSYDGPSIQFNNKLKYIGDRAFNGFKGSEVGSYQLYIDYGDNWKEHCESSAITLPSTLEYIGESAFSSYLGCHSNLVIPEGIETLKYGSFANFVGDSLTLPSTLKTVENGVFTNSYGFGEGSSLVIPNGVTSIGDEAFAGFAGNSLTLPSGITSIGNRTFGKYVGNENDVLVIPEGVTTIGAFAFQNYRGKGITFPSTLQKIDQWAFYYYNGDPIDIPSSVSLIGQSGEDSSGNPTITRTFNMMQNTITVHSQNLYDSRSEWTSYPDKVILDN